MTWIALAYHLASRLAYVLYVGVTLKRQDRAAYLTRRHGPEAAFRRFRRVAAIVMANDAVSLGVLCLVSANTLHLGLPRGLTIAVGAVLALVGVATKMWAAATLGDGYYWRNFFTPTYRVVPKAAGPYRWQEPDVYGGQSAGLRPGARDLVGVRARRRAVRSVRHSHVLQPGREAAFRAVASAAARARRQVCTWFRPPSFARYSARSAALTTWSDFVWRSFVSATPMLIVTGTRCPGPRSVNTFSFFFLERNRARRMKRVSSTVCRSASRSVRHSSAPRPAKITANSSPP